MSNLDRCETPCDEEELVTRMEDELPSSEHLEEIADIFGLLSDETRLKIISALAVYRELCVCDLSNVVELSLSATSHQLRRLRDAGVVSKRRDGRLTYYRLESALLARLFDQARDEVERDAA